MTDHVSVVRSWIGLGRRRWRTGLIVAGVIVLTAAAVLLLSRPVYRSEAALRLGQPPPQGGVSPNAGVLSFFQLGGDPFSNDLELIGSRSLAEAVVERVALTARVHAPAGWHRDSLFASLVSDRDTEKAKFEVRHVDGRVQVRRLAPDEEPIGQVAPGEPISFGGLTAVFLPYRAGMPVRFRISTIPFGEAVRSLRSGLDAQRPRREANIVALAYKHTDPGLADGVVAAAVDGFVAFRASIQQRESTQTVDSLRAVARQTADELFAAEEALKRLQTETLLVAPEAQSEALVMQRAELMGQFARATRELEAVDEMLVRLGDTQAGEQSWTALLGVPTFFESQTLAELLTELTGLHARRAELATRLSAETREARALDSQIQYLEGSLRRVAGEHRTGLLGLIRSLRPQLLELDRALGALPGQSTELIRRQRDVRVLTEVVVVTEQRLRQEELRDALTYANIQVIDPPALLPRPVWPRLKLGMAVAVLLAAAFGVLAMIVRDRLDTPIRVHSGQANDEVRAAWG